MNKSSDQSAHGERHGVHCRRDTWGTKRCQQGVDATGRPCRCADLPGCILFPDSACSHSKKSGAQRQISSTVKGFTPRLQEGLFQHVQGVEA
jgi:hypothetical protein